MWPTEEGDRHMQLGEEQSRGSEEYSMGDWQARQPFLIWHQPAGRRLPLPVSPQCEASQVERATMRKGAHSSSLAASFSLFSETSHCLPFFSFMARREASL